MPRLLLRLSILGCFSTAYLLCESPRVGFAEAQQSQAPPPSSQAPQPHNPATPAPTEAKATKKVWTNEDVGGLNGTVSVVGNAKPSAKPAPGKPADPKYIADVRKQLQKLRTQLDDTTKELADLKDFQAGKPASSSGYPLSKGYGRIPIDQQISSLEAKKKDLEDKIDALLDEARKKGVTPGDLR